jgi:hypothetical protein
MSPEDAARIILSESLDFDSLVHIIVSVSHTDSEAVLDDQPTWEMVQWYRSWMDDAVEHMKTEVCCCGSDTCTTCDLIDRAASRVGELGNEL